MVHQEFSAIATKLLNQTHLVIKGNSHRLVEIEFYYHHETHPDPFTHCHPEQLSDGQWYFHRQGRAYRGGSFKGVDLTFGSTDSFGGILLRSLETPEGKIIEGPSTCVEYMLQQTGYPKVADLDGAIARRDTMDESSPLFLQPTDNKQRRIFSCARVGLSLKRVDTHPNMPEYLLRPYRYLSIPKIRKGRVYLVLALHIQGISPEEIHQLTNSPRHIIKRYLEQFQQGVQHGEISSYFGKNLSNSDLCQLHGITERANW